MLTDLYDYAAVEERLTGYDACFFCLGVTSAGMSEASYARITYELTLAAANTLLRLNPRLVFEFHLGRRRRQHRAGPHPVGAGEGPDRERAARVAVRGGDGVPAWLIRPLHGITSRTRSYRLLYAVLAPVMPLLEAIAPGSVTTTERVGRAMIRVALEGAPKPVLETADINRLAG